MFRAALTLVYGVGIGLAAAACWWRDPLRLRRRATPAWRAKPRVSDLRAWARRPF